MNGGFFPEYCNVKSESGQRSHVSRITCQLFHQVDVLLHGRLIVQPFHTRPGVELGPAHHIEETGTLAGSVAAFNNAASSGPTRNQQRKEAFVQQVRRMGLAKQMGL